MEYNKRGCYFKGVMESLPKSDGKYYVSDSLYF